MSRHPSIKWAQRSDKVFITIELPDAENVKLTLQPDGRFIFSATRGPDKIQYEVDLELFDKVNVEESKASIGLRNICYLVKKAKKQWWSRLLKQEGKPPVFLKVDWDKWVDEDDECDTRDQDIGGLGDMDFSKLSMDGDHESADDEFGMDADDDGEEGEEHTDSTSAAKVLEESQAKV